MSTLSSDIRGVAIREALVRRSGAPVTSEALAQSTMDTWAHMAERLEPVIGARGVDALFSRSLHLVGKNHKWLDTSGVKGNDAVSLASIKRSFQGSETSTGMDAACALLATFTELLANLIGESLTTRLLAAVWLPLPSETQKEPPT